MDRAGNKKMRGKPPQTLEQLCVQKAIDNVHMLRDVGQTDANFLKVILPHCTAEQLLLIETETTGRDLSAITNPLWMNFYKRSFGDESTNLVISRMKEAKRTFKWKSLYQAKSREQADLQKKGAERLTELYLAAEAKKASRQMKQIDLVPPGSKRKQPGAFKGAAASAASAAAAKSSTSGKGRLMKKARKEFNDFKQGRPTSGSRFR